MITRFAPSLTGYLHLGHALHMLQVWGIARARGARVLCRIEDHDLARRRPVYETAILSTMEWLGFVPDEGMTASSPDGASDYRQSDCGQHYASALRLLEEKGLVYGCACSRRQILDEQAGGEGELCYAGTCSRKGLPLQGHAVRFRLPGREVAFSDLRLGECRQVPRLQCGDFPLRDRHGQWTYQFACVCDDIRHGVDLVVRGEDILPSTGRQILLLEALGYPPPAYFHHPLILGANGEKLSKRQRSESLSSLREKGVSAAEVLGRAAHAGGLLDAYRPLALEDALALAG